VGLTSLSSWNVGGLPLLLPQTPKRGVYRPLSARLWGGNSISVYASGKFAYLLNQAKAVIYELTVTDNQSGCVSGATGGITLNSTVAVGPTENIALDPYGRFLYGAEGGSNDLLGDLIDFSTGALSPIPGSPFAAGTFPMAMAWQWQVRVRGEQGFEHGVSILRQSIDGGLGFIAKLQTCQLEPAR
jgi:hypothetical protein